MTDLTRRGLLLGAATLGAGTLLSACSKTNVPLAPSPSGAVRAQLDAVMATYSKDRPQLGMALRDRRSNTTYDFNGSYSSQSASMAKVMIVLMALRKARQDGGTLSIENRALATKAIENSNNDAADALWAYAGGPDAYAKLAKDLGMANTKRDPSKDFWSWTWTTPLDQRLLLEKIMSGSPAIDNDDRGWLWGLMDAVQADQRWGVGVPSAPDVNVEMKNGWVLFSSSDKQWAVNSIGHVQGRTRDYVLTIMSRVPDFATGRDLTSAIGQSVWDIMGSGQLA